MSQSKRIYLDNAATSWPKPEPVYAAVERSLRELGAPAGRSTYGEAEEVERLIGQARRQAAALIGASDTRHLVFTANGTDSLNLAIHGLLRPGDHVITTDAEHNSVLRPLRFLTEHADLRVDYIPCDSQGQIDPDTVHRAILPDTKLIALIHASNVTGVIQPVEDVGRIARDHGIPFLLDASQSLGHVPVDVSQIGIDLLAAPGHKGLLGPLGTGLLYVAPGMEEKLLPIRQGGTGTQSEDDRQPESLPDRYESGNLNVPGIIGLGAGIQYLDERGLESCREHELRIIQSLWSGLASIEGVRLFGAPDPAARTGVISLTIDGYDPQEVASMLDSGYRIQTRPGLHCAPRMHQALGTAGQGGTVRLSPGVFTVEEDIDTTIRAISEIAAAAVEV